MKFRKSIKLGKGVRVNIGKKGISSVSLGGKGTTLNVGSKGVKATVGVPRTGISETINLSKKRSSVTDNRISNQENNNEHGSRQVGILLAIGIILMPYIFAWFTLRRGHSFISRFTSFSWAAFLFFIAMNPTTS